MKKLILFLIISFNIMNIHAQNIEVTVFQSTNSVFRASSLNASEEFHFPANSVKQILNSRRPNLRNFNTSSQKLDKPTLTFSLKNKDYPPIEIRELYGNVPTRTGLDLKIDVIKEEGSQITINYAIEYSSVINWIFSSGPAVPEIYILDINGTTTLNLQQSYIIQTIYIPTKYNGINPFGERLTSRQRQSSNFLTIIITQRL